MVRLFGRFYGLLLLLMCKFCCGLADCILLCCFVWRVVGGLIYVVVRVFAGCVARAG